MTAVHRKQVAVLVDTATGWGRNIIRGIDRFSREQGDWDLAIRPYAQVEYLPLPPRWRGDGIIARVASARMARELSRTGEPVVNVSSLPVKGADFPRIIAHFVETGRMAADHLLGRGFRHFAFCMPENAPDPSGRLLEGFRARLHEAGYESALLVLPVKPASAERRLNRVVRWLRTQERPMGIFAWSIDAPHELVGACRLGDFSIPEEVGILSSASADELIMQVSNPTISCVVTPETSIGYGAAEILQRLMDGATIPDIEQTTWVHPSHVEVRESTDVLQVGDPALIKAIRFIQDHATQPIRVQDVARHAGISRRTLEQRMRMLMQRSPAEEIRQIRLNRAKQLLRETMLSIPDVAERAGFGTVEHFITYFKNAAGVTPLQYAKKNRISGFA